MNIFETAGPSDGHRATETAHRKIELQSPADLTYLIANVSRAAREKLDKHLPPDATPEGEDAMRKRVEQLVDDYIRNTFNAAKDSMSINGMDSQELEAELAKAQEGEEIEPFDTKLAQRLQGLSSQIERETVALANLRRTAPGESSERFRERFERQTAQDDERLEKAREAQIEVGRTTAVDVGELERMEDVRTTLARGDEGLRELKTGMGSTVARMEKARKAVGVVEAK